MDDIFLRRRRKRESEVEGSSAGRIYVAKSDGRYRKVLITGRLEFPSAIAVDPALGKIFWTDAGDNPKLEVADMNGQDRRVLVDERIFFPTSLTIDYAKDHRIFWTDPKEGKVDSVLPDGTGRMVAVSSDKKPYLVDVFENWLYWATQRTGEVFSEDKFGQGKKQLLRSDLRRPHALRVYQKFKYNVSLSNPCEFAQCSHLCLLIPLNQYRCSCPDGSHFQEDSTTVCTAGSVPALPGPQSCQCRNGGVCREDGVCKCRDGFEGTYCEKGSSAQYRPVLLGRSGQMIVQQ